MTQQTSVQIKVSYVLHEYHYDNGVPCEGIDTSKWCQCLPRESETGVFRVLLVYQAPGIISHKMQKKSSIYIFVHSAQPENVTCCFVRNYEP